jgi:4-hydroxy-tetrahydrodipicolinate synthase
MSETVPTTLPSALPTRAPATGPTSWGVIPALVTPLDSRGELMEQGLREVIDFTIENGVHGLFILGSSGEIYGLTDRQKQRVVEITVEHTAGRVPIFCGASEITTRDCIRTALMVSAVGGVTALSVLTPYFLTPNQSELIEHFTTIARASELPIMLYGNDGRTHVRIEVDTCQQLSKVDGIIGIKDSSGDMTRMLDYLRVTDDSFTVLSGRDTLIYAGLCHGARGAIASTANIAPRLVSEIYDAYVAGDHARSLELQFQLAPLRSWIEKATFPVVLKEGLRLLGIDAGVALAPAGELTPGQRHGLQSVINNLSLASTVR